MSDAIAGKGAAFKRSDMASSPTFTAVAEVANIGGPSLSRNIIDVTNLDSTGGYREFIGGFRDGGEVTIDMNFLRDSFIDLKADLESDSLRNYQVVFPDTGNTTLEFAALITALNVNSVADDKISASATFKISGQTTVTS